ncbi:unnamed protein product [Sphagnum tenellum]
MGPENRNRRFSSKGENRPHTDGKVKVAADSKDPVATDSAEQEGMTATCVLDFGRYSEIFELKEVDNAVLPLLTMDDDLRENGH